MGALLLSNLIFPGQFVHLTFSRRLNFSVNFSHIFIVYSFSDFSALFGLRLSSKKVCIFQLSFNWCPIIMKWGPDHTERRKKTGACGNVKMRGCLPNSSYFSRGGKEHMLLEREECVM